jgi:hypothetical protein
MHGKDPGSVDSYIIQKKDEFEWYSSRPVELSIHRLLEASRRRKMHCEIRVRITLSLHDNLTQKLTHLAHLGGGKR